MRETSHRRSDLGSSMRFSPMWTFFMYTWRAELCFIQRWFAHQEAKHTRKPGNALGIAWILDLFQSRCYSHLQNRSWLAALNTAPRTAHVSFQGKALAKCLESSLANDMAACFSLRSNHSRAWDPSLSPERWACKVLAHLKLVLLHGWSMKGTLMVAKISALGCSREAGVHDIATLQQVLAHLPDHER